MALLTPSQSPGVLEDPSPVVLIADVQHEMVELLLTIVKDTAFVELPISSVNSNCNREVCKCCFQVGFAADCLVAINLIGPAICPAGLVSCHVGIGSAVLQSVILGIAETSVCEASLAAS